MRRTLQKDSARQRQNVLDRVALSFLKVIDFELTMNFNENRIEIETEMNRNLTVNYRNI